MAERGLKMIDVIQATGIAKTTIRALYYNTGKGVQFETLTTLCDYFDVDVGEILTKMDINVDYSSIKMVSENTYTAVIDVVSGYKKISGEVRFILEDIKTVDLVIPMNIYRVLSSLKHIDIDFMKKEVILPVLRRINMPSEQKNYKVSVEEGYGSESGQWLSNTHYARQDF